MGTIIYFVNHTRKEFFLCPFGKWSEILLNPFQMRGILERLKRDWNNCKIELIPCSEIDKISPRDYKKIEIDWDSYIYEDQDKELYLSLERQDLIDALSNSPETMEKVNNLENTVKLLEKRMKENNTLLEFLEKRMKENNILLKKILEHIKRWLENEIQLAKDRYEESDGAYSDFCRGCLYAFKSVLVYIYKEKESEEEEAREMLNSTDLKKRDRYIERLMKEAE